MLLFAGGIVVYSKDKLPVENAAKADKTVEPAKVQKKFYIELNNGQLIELLTKAEVTKAKKDNFKVVER